MKWLLSLVVVCGLVSFSSADDVKVSVVESPVSIYSFGEVNVALEKGDQVSFQVFPTPKKKVTAGGKLLVGGIPGTKYTILVTVVNFGDNGGVKRFDTGQLDLPFAGEPTPTPDVDPEPIPVPDVGVTALQAAILAAWKTDPAEERGLAKSLAAVYAKYADPQEIAKYQTWGALEMAMRADAEAAKVTGKLVQTQTAVHGYLIKYLPGNKDGWEKLAISKTGASSAKTAFGNVSRALLLVK